MKKQVKALQAAKRHFQKTVKNRDVELAHCRDLLVKTTKELAKLKMAKPVEEPQSKKYEEDTEKEGGVQCTYCDYEACSMTQLKSHFKKHHKQECKKCDQKFLHKHALDVHIKEHHTVRVK